MTKRQSICKSYIKLNKCKKNHVLIRESNEHYRNWIWEIYLNSRRIISVEPPHTSRVGSSCSHCSSPASTSTGWPPTLKGYLIVGLQFKDFKMLTFKVNVTISESNHTYTVKYQNVSQCMYDCPLRSWNGWTNLCKFSKKV